MLEESPLLVCWLIQCAIWHQTQAFLHQQDAHAIESYARRWNTLSIQQFSQLSSLILKICLQFKRLKQEHQSSMRNSNGTFFAVEVYQPMDKAGTTWKWKGCLLELDLWRSLHWLLLCHSRCWLQSRLNLELDSSLIALSNSHKWTPWSGLKL